MIIQSHAEAGRLGVDGDGMDFGLHLVADLYCRDLSKLDDRDALVEFTAKMVELIDMVPYGPCVAESFAHDNPIASGYTVYQLIETSNLSMHLSPFLGGVYLDIFSCKWFDTDAALQFAAKFFDVQLARVTVIRR